MSLQEVNEVANVISSICADDANIIFGTSVDETYADEIAVTVVATSFDVPKGNTNFLLNVQASPGSAGAALDKLKYSEWQARSRARGPSGSGSNRGARAEARPARA